MKQYPFKSLFHYKIMIFVAIMITVTASFVRASEIETTTDYAMEDCIECHQTGSDESELQISVDEYKASVHGGQITCMDCHTGVIDDDHQTTEGSGKPDCSACHEQENGHGLNGSEKERPQCHDCHTRHHMVSKTDPASTVHPDQLAGTCARCHPAASGKTGFFGWFPAFRIASHPKADFAAAYKKDNCLGCHQGAAAHGESDPINGQDCHQCHLSPEAAGAMWGVMHPAADMDTQPAIFVAASIYQVLVVIGLIVLLRHLFALIFNRFSGKSGFSGNRDRR